MSQQNTLQQESGISTYLPVQRELEVLCSKNIIRNFIPMVKMFWLSGTADYLETDYH